MIPYCYTAGVVLALLVSALFAFLSFMSMHFMIEAAFAVRRYDYNGLFDHCFGRKRRWILNVCIALVQLGAFMIYCHWNGKLLCRLVNSNHVLIGADTFWIFLITTFIVYPLTFFRQISKLDKVSMMSFFFVVILISHSLYWLFKDYAKSGFDPQGQLRFFALERWEVIVAAFGINCMAYNCHLNLFPCLESLRDCTLRRGHYLGALTMCTSFLLYNGLGLVTYLNKFDGLGPASVLEFFDKTNPFTMVTMCGVILVLVTSSPAVCFFAPEFRQRPVLQGRPRLELEVGRRRRIDIARCRLHRIDVRECAPLLPSRGRTRNTSHHPPAPRPLLPEVQAEPANRNEATRDLHSSLQRARQDCQHLPGGRRSHTGSQKEYVICCKTTLCRYIHTRFKN
jgi:hypothetical protein